MDVGWKVIRIVQRTDSDETHCVPRTGVVAPERDVASWTARDPLPLAAIGRREDHLNLAFKALNSISFDQRVQRERSPGLTLTPPAMAAVDKQRP